MAFRSANITAHMIKFNSAASSNFLYMYQNMIAEEIRNENSDKKRQTFAPSQMRCDRVSWFRLRGTQPDVITNPDPSLSFTAQMGTACHEAIQDRLSTNLRHHPDSEWISVEEWVHSYPGYFADYDMDIKQKGHESLIDLRRPFPVSFACDGIIKFEGKVYLLEIKTAEFSSLNDLIEPKPKHMDQIKCYSTLMHIPNVLFLYQDRQYGQMKCFEVEVKQYEWEAVRNKMQRVMDMVEANIAPEGLSVGDPDCTQNMCPYYKVCKEWGR